MKKMARRKKRSRRRTPKTISLYDAAVAWGNLTILTEGTVGSGPIGFFTGDFDLKAGTTSIGDSWGSHSSSITTISGGSQISLRDMLNEPGLSFGQIQENVKANAVGIAMNAILFNAGARVLKRAIRQPINQANRLIRPLNMGVRI
jgi:hypothetical protein